MTDRLPPISIDELSDLVAERNAREDQTRSRSARLLSRRRRRHARG